MRFAWWAGASAVRGGLGRGAGAPGPGCSELLLVLALLVRLPSRAFAAACMQAAPSRSERGAQCLIACLCTPSLDPSLPHAHSMSTKLL